VAISTCSKSYDCLSELNFYLCFYLQQGLDGQFEAVTHRNHLMIPNLLKKN